MSTSAMSAPEPGRINNFMALIGHHGAAVRIGCIAGIAASTAMPDSWAIVGITIMVLAIAGFVLTTIAETSYHVGSICLRCFHETPLENPKLAEKKKPQLKRFHWFTPRRCIILIVIILTTQLGSIALGNLAHHLIMPLTLVPACYLAYLGIIHRRLQPWCPWCRHRGHGDDDDDVVVPDGPPGYSKDSPVPAAPSA